MNGLFTATRDATCREKDDTDPENFQISEEFARFDAVKLGDKRGLVH